MEFFDRVSKVEIKGCTNPFNKNGFFLEGAESFLKGIEVHRILEIKVVYKNKTALIKFKKSDFITGAVVYAMIAGNFFGFDHERDVFFNNVKLYDKTFDKVKIFNEIISLSDYIDERNHILIVFSKTKWGENAYKFNKQNIIYEVSPDYFDEYFFIKKIKQINNGILTDDEV